MNAVVRKIKSMGSMLIKIIASSFSKQFFVFSMLSGFFLSSCLKDKEFTVLNEDASLKNNTVSKDIVLNETKKDEVGLVVRWEKPKFGTDLAVDYNVYLDKYSGNFTKAVRLCTTKELSCEMKVGKLNQVLIDAGIQAGNATKVKVRIIGVLSSEKELVSNSVAFDITPYQTKVDITTPWGLVGSATPNEWNGPDIPFYKSETSGKLVCYGVLKKGEIKIRKDNKWDKNYGSGTGTGNLKEGGSNIKVNEASGYKIEFDPSKLTYTIEKYFFGLVGSATPNGWSGPDEYFYKTKEPDQWVCHAALKAGEIKIRKNNDWAKNYGQGDSAGTLKEKGDNIKVTDQGDYRVIFNSKKLTYTLEKYSWGLIGDAAKGWNKGDDVKLKYDYITDKWMVTTTLKKGGFKFRLNGEWTHNLGATDAAASTLKKDGTNIKVSESGSYEIVLGVSDTPPHYKITKK